MDQLHSWVIALQAKCLPLNWIINYLNFEKNPLILYESFFFRNVILEIARCNGDGWLLSIALTAAPYRINSSTCSLFPNWINCQKEVLAWLLNVPLLFGNFKCSYSYNSILHVSILCRKNFNYHLILLRPMHYYHWRLKCSDSLHIWVINLTPLCLPLRYSIIDINDFSLC